MWGKHSQKVINAWCIHTTKHQAIIGGNLFVMFMMNRNVARPMYIDSYYIKNKVNILVTLYGDEYLPEYLINSVERSPDAYNWHFRNHPTNHVSKKLAKRILTLKNTEIEFSSNSLLYDLLPEVDIHITGFSTTAFEAQSFGVPTIFTHINAKNGYGDIIGRNGMFYTDSQEYLDLLINKLSSSHEKIIPEYIDSNIETAYSALSKIINN